MPTALFATLLLLGSFSTEAREQHTKHDIHKVKLNEEGMFVRAGPTTEDNAAKSGLRGGTPPPEVIPAEEEEEEAAASGDSGEITRAGNIPGLGDLLGLSSNNNLNMNGRTNGEGQEEEEEEVGEFELEGELSKSNQTETEIGFHCDLDIVFFEGEGMQPKGTEVKTLVKKTEEWFSKVLAKDLTFLGLEITEDDRTYDSAEPDKFSFDFSTAVTVDLEQANDHMTIAGIASMVGGADFEEYVRDFLWEAVPKKMNVFYQTHAIDMKCTPGKREEEGGARRLRGGAAFGGFHEVAAHQDA